MMMQGRDAHARDSCKIFQAQRFGVIRPDPCNRFCCAVALVSERGNRAEASALRPAQDTVDYFALNEAAEEWNVARRVQQVHEAAAGIEQLSGGLTGDHAWTVRWRFWSWNFLAAQELADYGHFKFENEAEIRHFFTGLDHVADDWEIERGEQVAGLVENECGSGEVRALAALRDHGEAGLVGAGGRGGGGGTAAEAQAGDLGYHYLSRPSKKGNPISQSLAQFIGAI